jgi:hypothetical protein
MSHTKGSSTRRARWPTKTNASTKRPTNLSRHPIRHPSRRHEAERPRRSPIRRILAAPNRSSLPSCRALSALCGHGTIYRFLPRILRIARIIRISEPDKKEPHNSQFSPDPRQKLYERQGSDGLTPQVAVVKIQKFRSKPTPGHRCARTGCSPRRRIPDGARAR